MQALGLNTVVLDDDARAADDLARVALTVDLAETGPGAEDLGVSDLDQVDLVLSAETACVSGARRKDRTHASMSLAYSASVHDSFRTQR